MPDGRWKREGPARLMVSNYSALLGLPGEDSLACQANHTQIAKLKRGENGYYYAIKGAVLKVAGSPTILFGMDAGDDNVNKSRRSPQKNIRGASQIKDDHTAETSRTGRSSSNRISGKQINTTSETQEETLGQENFLSSGLKIPKQSRSSVDSSSEDEVTSALKTGNLNPRSAPPDPDTTASKKSRTASGTSDVHRSPSTCEPESSAKKNSASNLHFQERLCQAVLHGDIPLVTALLGNGCSPHTSKEEAVELSQDPFLLAARRREEKILELFLKFHANPLKHTLKKSHTALHLLSLPYDWEQNCVTRSLVTLLLRCGTSIEARNKDDMTPLILSAKNGESDLVSYLLDSGADLKAIHLSSGRTPLHWAARYDHRQIVDTLISKGASLEVRTNNGFTPLLEVASLDNLETLQSLLDHSANPQARTNDGMTASHLAAMNNHPAVLGSLISRKVVPKAAKDKQGLTPLMHGCQKGHTEVLKLLLDHKVDLNARSDDGSTALHYASSAGHLSAINHLVSRDASLDAKDRQGLTPLMFSIYYSHLQVFERLLERGADLNASDSHGWTSLHHAAHRDFLAAADLLISKGALLEARTSKIQHTYATPLHVSTYRKDNSGGCTKLLLKAGADMEARNRDGETALILAASNGAVNALNELIASGANIEAMTDTWNYRRALHAARFYGNWQIIEVLLRNGADPFATGIDRNIPSQLGWFRGDRVRAAPSDTDKDRCMRLLKDAEEAERQNRNRKEKDRRQAKNIHGQKGKSKGLFSGFMRSRRGSS